MIKPKLIQCCKCPENKLLPAWKVEHENGEKKYYCRYHWTGKQLREKKKEMKPIVDKDERFYRFLWNNRNHSCTECGKQLKEFNKDIFHHLLPKFSHPYFRYESKNIVFLCGKFGCHSKAESAIEYPKMKIFKHCEKIKLELLASVGIEYSPKTI